MNTPQPPTPAGVRPPAPAGLPREPESLAQQGARWFEDYFLRTRPRT